MKNLLLFFTLIPLLISCNNNNTVVTEQQTKDSIQQLLRLMRDSINNNPNDTSLKFEYIVAMQDAGQYREAINFLDTMNLQWGDSSSARIYFNSLYKRAELLAQAGDTTAAIKTLEFFVIPGELTEAGLQLANLYAETKNPKALAICDSMIKNDESKRDPNPDYLKGVYFYNIGDNTRALEQFDLCIKKDYTFTDAYMEKGRILYKQEKYKEALDVYDLAIKVSNSFADAHLWKGKCQEALGQKEDAKISYQRAYAFDKTLIEAKEAADRINN